MADQTAERPSGQSEGAAKRMLPMATVAGLAFVVAVLFIAFNVATVPRINPDPAIGGDASQYIAMTHGELGSVPQPFRFRVLVPFVASALPLSAGHALMAITYTCMCALFVVLVCITYRLTHDLAASLTAVLVVLSSRWLLYNFQNPYLTDSFTLAAISVSLGALFLRWRPAFWPAVVLGTLARETALPFSLAWGATRQWRATAAIAGVSFVVYLVPRLVIDSDVATWDFLWTAVRRYGAIADPSDFVAQAVFSWGYVFAFAGLGFALLPATQRPTLVVAFVLLLLTAVASSLVAVDFGRMFEVLAPVFALAVGRALQVLRRTSATGDLVIAALLVLMAVQCLTFVPNDLLAGQPPRTFRWALEGVGLALAAITYLGVRRAAVLPLWRGVRRPVWS